MARRFYVPLNVYTTDEGLSADAGAASAMLMVYLRRVLLDNPPRAASGWPAWLLRIEGPNCATETTPPKRAPVPVDFMCLFKDGTWQKCTVEVPYEECENPEFDEEIAAWIRDNQAKITPDTAGVETIVAWNVPAKSSTNAGPAQ